MQQNYVLCQTRTQLELLKMYMIGFINQQNTLKRRVCGKEQLGNIQEKLFIDPYGGGVFLSVLFKLNFLFLDVVFD